MSESESQQPRPSGPQAITRTDSNKSGKSSGGSFANKVSNIFSSFRKDKSAIFKTATSYPINKFPPEIAAVMRRFDVDGDGHIDQAELDCAARLYEAGLSRQTGDWKIPFDVFPEKMHADLKLLDDDGDGQIDAKEVERAIAALVGEKKRSRMLQTALIGVSIFTLLLLLAIGGMTFAIVEMSKDTKLSSSGAMIGKSSSEAVQTASSDFVLLDGMLVPRSNSSEEAQPIAVNEASFHGQLDSAAANAAFLGLRTITIEHGPDAIISLNIFGMARMPDAASEHGTVVELFTDRGTLTVDGIQLSGDQSLRALFERAGMALEGGALPPTRRLIPEESTGRRGHTSNSAFKPKERNPPGSGCPVGSCQMGSFSGGQKQSMLAPMPPRRK